jgi:peptide/nickel transport system substrate-binding protein
MRRARDLGRRSRRVLAAGCAMVGLAALAAACGPASSSASGGTTAVTGGTATYAMAPGSVPTYIFPFIDSDVPAGFSVTNVNEFQYLMYRPLYWFGTGATPYLNKSVSLAYPPTYSGQKVTIKLKPGLKWSNGEPVNAADVEFWMNMMVSQNGQNPNLYWADDTSAGLPNDVTNFKAHGDTFTMDIKGKYSQAWFTNNELSQLTPMPMAWDRTASGKSDCVTNETHCMAVYLYLDGLSNGKGPGAEKTWASSPIWQVVDGPWRLKSLTSQGVVTLAYNDKYVGPAAPHHITTLVQQPFTSEASEYNVLQDPGNGQTIDVGYLPTVDAPEPPAGANVGANPSTLSGYSLNAVYPWQLSYFPYNFKNKTGQGAIFRQLYFRTAFQYLVDQAGVIAGPLHGYGKATVGPVASYPPTSWLSPQLAKQSDPWALNIPKAKSILAANGWSPGAGGGPDTCTKAGTGPGECGAGIPAGTQLKFNFEYASGVDWMESAARELASNASLAGIGLNVTANTFTNVVDDAFSCFEGPSAAQECKSWQLAEWGSWTYDPDYLPTGETLFSNGAVNNAGQYSTTQDDNLIDQTVTARSQQAQNKAMYAWQNYLSAQLPVVWQPDTPTLIETIKGLQIGVQNSALTITPEDWYFTK